MSEKLAMLAAKALDWRRIPGGHGSITPQDIAHALATIRDPAIALFARVDGAGDESSLAPLERKMLLDLTDVSIRERWASDKRWRNHQADTMRRLIRLAIYEAIAGTICRTCNGRRGVMAKGKWMQCAACDGIGHKGWTDRERSQYSGVHEDTFYKVWRQRYRDHIQGLIMRYRDRIHSAMRRLG